MVYLLSVLQNCQLYKYSILLNNALVFVVYISIFYTLYECPQAHRHWNRNPPEPFYVRKYKKALLTQHWDTSARMGRTTNFQFLQKIIQSMLIKNTNPTIQLKDTVSFLNCLYLPTQSFLARRKLGNVYDFDTLYLFNAFLMGWIIK